MSLSLIKKYILEVSRSAAKSHGNVREYYIQSMVTLRVITFCNLNLMYCL